jgi:hypothetical protein
MFIKTTSLSGWANVGEELQYQWRNLIKGLDQKVKLLTVLSPEQLHKRWVVAGKPTLADFGLVWVHIHPTPGFDGVSYINDVKHRKMFQIMIEDPVVRIDITAETTSYWEKVACLVAIFANLPKLGEKPRDVLPEGANPEFVKNLTTRMIEAPPGPQVSTEELLDRAQGLGIIEKAVAKTAKVTIKKTRRRK